MSTDQHRIVVNGVAVDVARKDIRNLHLGVYPPNGRVRVAAPIALTDDAVRLAVIAKFGWIRRQQSKFQTQPRQSQRDLVNGESHYVFGRRLRLRVTEVSGAERVEVLSAGYIELHVKPGTIREHRERLLESWYRVQLKALIPALVEKWESALSVQVNDWRVKKMKTKWGSCSVEARRIWLNLELAKKPVECLDYVVVHELLHLAERHHDDRFLKLLDKYLPRWRLYKDELNRGPLAHTSWTS